MEKPKYLSLLSRFLLLLTILSQLQSISAHPLSSGLESKNSAKEDNSVASAASTNPKDEVIKQRSDSDVLPHENNIEERSLIPFINLKYFDVDSAEDAITKYKTDVKAASPESRSKLTNSIPKPGNNALLPAKAPTTGLSMMHNNPHMKPNKKPVSTSTGKKPNSNANSDGKSSESEIPIISHSSYQTQSYQSSMSGKDAVIELSLHSSKPQDEAEELDPQATTILNQLLAPLVENAAVETKAVKLGVKGMESGHIYQPKSKEIPPENMLPAVEEPPAFVPMITQDSEEILAFMIAQESNPLSSVELNPETAAGISKPNELLIPLPPTLKIEEHYAVEETGTDQQSHAPIPTTTSTVIEPIFPVFMGTWTPEDSEDFEEKTPQSSLDLLSNSEESALDTIFRPLPLQKGDKFYGLVSAKLNSISGHPDPLNMKPINRPLGPTSGKPQEMNNPGVQESSGLEIDFIVAQPLDGEKDGDGQKEPELSQGQYERPNIQRPSNRPNSSPGKLTMPLSKPLKPSQPGVLKPVQEYLDDTSEEFEDLNIPEVSTTVDKVVIPQQFDSSEEDLELSHGDNPPIGHQSGRPNIQQFNSFNRPNASPGKVTMSLNKPLKPSSPSPVAIAENLKPESPGVIAEDIKPESPGVIAEDIKPESLGVIAEDIKPESLGVIAEDIKPESPGVIAEDIKPESPAVIAENIKPESPGVIAEDIKPESPGVIAEDIKPESPGVIAENIKPESPGVIAEDIKPESSVTIAEDIKPETLSVNSKDLLKLVHHQLQSTPGLVLPPVLMELIASQKSNSTIPVPPSVPASVAPVKAKPSVPASVAPVKAKPSVPVSVAPVKAKPSVPASVAPVKAKPSVPVSVTPVKAKPSVPASVAPVKPKPSVPVSVAPVKAKPSAPMSVTPVKAKPSVPVSVAPVKAKPSVPVSVALVKAKPSVPVSVAPLKAKPSVPASVAPVKAKPSVPVSVAPVKAKPSAPASVAPVKPKPSVPVSVAPVKAKPSVPVSAAPVKAKPSVPVSVAPVKAKPSVPVSVAPVKAKPSVPVSVAPVKAKPSVPVSVAPVKAEPSIPESVAPVNAEPSIPESLVETSLEPQIQGQEPINPNTDKPVISGAKPGKPQAQKPSKPQAVKPSKPRPEFGIQPNKDTPQQDKDTAPSSFMGQASKFIANILQPLEPLMLIPKIGWDVFSITLGNLFKPRQKKNKVALRLELDEDCIEDLVNSSGDYDLLRTIRSSFETASYACSDESSNKSCSQLCISSGFDMGKCVDGLEGGCVCGVEPEGSHSKLGLVLTRFEPTLDIARSTSPDTFDFDNCEDCRCSAECKKSGAYVGYCGDTCYCGLPWHDGSLTF